MPFDVTFIPKPSENSGTHASFAGAEVLAVMKNSKNKDAAQKLIEFLIKPDVAMEIAKLWPAIFPSHVDAGKDPWFTDHPMHKVFYEQNKYAKPVPSIAVWPKIEDVLKDLVEEIILTDKSIASILTKYNTIVQDILDGKR